MLTFNKALAEGFKYVIESERGEKRPFSISIEPINSVKLMTLEDGLLKRDQNNSLSISTGSFNASLCTNAITGWANMVDEKGKAIPIKLDPAGYITIESLEKVPSTIITEIAGVISSVSQDAANIQIFTDVE